MKTINFTLIFIFMTVTFSFSQNCDCNSNFEWMKKTFEENDAGFQYIINKKGQSAYNLHNKLMLEKIRNAKNSDECSRLLSEWLMFFRSGHIGIEHIIDETSSSQTTAMYETWSGNIQKFEEYIKIKKEADFEGVWETDPYKIGIKREGTNYIGFIIESGVDSWKPCMVKLKIEQDGNTLKSTFYMQNHLPVKNENTELLGKNYLLIGQWLLLKRLSPVFPEYQPVIENYNKIMNASEPYLEELNATTLYLRIPSFRKELRFSIDSVIDANRNRILKTKNLIIDLRNNGGGSDEQWENLIPFLYTNPIRRMGTEFLSTKLNNQFWLNALTTPNKYITESERERYENFYDSLQSKVGEFVKLDDKDFFIATQNSVYEYPKNVGIIMNKNCASATEGFLFEAKQSKKVKLFGTSTSGMFDISNVITAESPDKEFRLYYGMSRNLGISDFSIDDIGFQPDFYIDKTIPQYKWVEFVNEILNEQ